MSTSSEGLRHAAMFFYQLNRSTGFKNSGYYRQDFLLVASGPINFLAHGALMKGWLCFKYIFGDLTIDFSFICLQERNIAMDTPGKGVDIGFSDI